MRVRRSGIFAVSLSVLDPAVNTTSMPSCSISTYLDSTAIMSSRIASITSGGSFTRSCTSTSCRRCFAAVRADDDALVVGHDADQVHGQHLHHVVLGHHLAALHQFGANAVDN